MTKLQMTNDSPGEIAERAQNKRLQLKLAAFMLLGGIFGMAIAYIRNSEAGTLPSSIAILLVILLLVGGGVGGYLFQRSVDELEKRHNLEAGSAALSVYMLLYPSWFFLWKGNLAPEPDHIAIFMIVMLTTAILYYGRKIRG